MPPAAIFSGKFQAMLFQITWKSLTSGDLAGHWQPARLAILAMAEFLVFYRYLSLKCFHKTSAKKLAESTDEIFISLSDKISSH